jgi:hypothetical protein
MAVLFEARRDIAAGLTYLWLLLAPALFKSSLKRISRPEI